MKNFNLIALGVVLILALLLFTHIISFVIFIISVFIIIIAMTVNSTNETFKNNDNHRIKTKLVLDELMDFKADHFILSQYSDISVAFDNQRKKICFLDAIHKTWIYEYDKILQSEIVIDAQTITNRRGTISRSIMGEMLAGDSGAIIGGTTGTTISNESVNSILIKITINNTVNPIFKIIFLADTVQKGSSTYNIHFLSAEKLQGVLTGIIKQNSTNIAKIPNSNLSMADELTKLKNLLDSGVLSKVEFDNQKKKLLDK